MITTVIVWPQPEFNTENRGFNWVQNPTPLQIEELSKMANTIVSGFASNIRIFVNEDDTVRTSVRNWPDV